MDTIAPASAVARFGDWQGHPKAKIQLRQPDLPIGRDALSVDAKATKHSDTKMPRLLIPLAEAIRSRREVLGYSQEKLADRCGFDRTYISMLECGKRNPSFLNLLRLAEGLDTSVSQLTEAYKHGTHTRR